MFVCVLCTLQPPGESSPGCEAQARPWLQGVSKWDADMWGPGQPQASGPEHLSLGGQPGLQPGPSCDIPVLECLAQCRAVWVLSEERQSPGL